MAINIPGIVSVVLFYIVILAVGIWAGRKSKKTGSEPGDADEVMLAGRNIGIFVGIFTMTGASSSPHGGATTAMRRASSSAFCTGAAMKISER